MLIVSIVGFHEHDRCAGQGMGALAHRAMPSGRLTTVPRPAHYRE
jgi:hypothetical protein